MRMPLISVSLFAVACLNLGLASFTLLRGPRKPLNLLFFILGLTLSLWTVSHGIAISVSTDSAALLWTRLIMIGPIILPMLFGVFTRFLPGKKFKCGRGFLSFHGCLAGLFFLLLPTSAMIKDAVVAEWGIRWSGGWAFNLYSIYYLVFMGDGLRVIIRKLKSAKTAERMQLLYVAIGATVSILFGLLASMLLPILGIYELNKFGPAGTLVMVGSFSYAIVRYGLLDVNLALRQASVMALSAALMSAPFILVAWISDSRAVVYLAIFAAFLFGIRIHGRLSTFLASAVDRLPFFRGRYEEFQRLHLHFKSIAQAQTVSDWAKRIVEVAGRLFHPERVMILVREEHKKRFLIRGSSGVDAASAVFSFLPFDGALAGLLTRTREVFIADCAKEMFTREAQQEVQTDIQLFQASVFVPIVHDDVLYAVLVLGTKSEGRVYHSLDLTSLEALARASEHALRVVLSGLSQEQLTAVWAHDLVKPFSAKGSFNLLDDLLSGSMGPLSEPMQSALKLMRGDADFVKRNLGRLLHPLQSATFEILPGPLTDLFERVRDKFEGYAVRQGIQWTVSVPPMGLRAFFDSAMIEHRVLANLVENAFRHTPRGGSVTLGYDVQRSLRIYVKDTGIGIKEKDVDQLFQPRSQLEGGVQGLAGLGLFSAKIVVDAHKGTIGVESSFGKGSTFFFDLPLASVPFNDSPIKKA